MADIMAASRAQGLRVRLSTVGPLFRVTATRVGGDGDVELGRAEGAVRPWPGGSVLHLDSMRMSRATLEVPDRPLFGLGIFLGAVTVRHGFDAGCVRAELLAINDTPLYHNKLVKFYTRMGFKAVHEVDGSSMMDLAHMLVWGVTSAISMHNWFANKFTTFHLQHFHQQETNGQTDCIFIFRRRPNVRGQENGTQLNLQGLHFLRDSQALSTVGQVKQEISMIRHSLRQGILASTQSS
ncbi:hypothetical protein TRIUR3_09276 [Triticum urartu]|uniref:Uncharacterized protein n=1 Tax=Triticum urartu TaxID=4572 RepID=M8AQ90_TRIUA|nr:hypothetical protein TRIUR3_09276 [Triticum urartu]